MKKLKMFKESHPALYHALMLGAWEAVIMAGLKLASSVDGTFLYGVIRVAVGIPGLLALWHCVLLIVSLARFAFELEGVLEDNWKDR